MSRYLRYLLIWLSCTAISVTAVVLTVHFVVGSTKPTPLVARSAPTVFASATSRSPSPSRTPEPTPTRSRTPTPTTSSPEATEAPPKPAPKPTSAPPESGSSRPDTGATDCREGGSGVHTIESAGGQASVRFAEDEVCLVSAVPTRGFTVRTEQTERTELTVTFSGDRQESVITATTVPEPRATVEERSW